MHHVRVKIKVKVKVIKDSIIIKVVNQLSKDSGTHLQILKDFLILLHVNLKVTLFLLRLHPLVPILHHLRHLKVYTHRLRQDLQLHLAGIVGKV